MVSTRIACIVIQLLDACNQRIPMSVAINIIICTWCQKILLEVRNKCTCTQGLWVHACTHDFQNSLCPQLLTLHMAINYRWLCNIITNCVAPTWFNLQLMNHVATNHVGCYHCVSGSSEHLLKLAPPD